MTTKTEYLPGFFQLMLLNAQRYQRSRSTQHWSRKWLYRSAGAAFLGAVTLQQLFPAEGTFAHKEFGRRAYEDGLADGRLTAKNLLNYFRWFFVVSSIGFMTPFAVFDTLFNTKRRAIEFWLEFHYLTRFVKNEENWVVFRGESRQAAQVFEDGRHRTTLIGSLCTGDIGPPSVVDATVQPDGITSFSHGVVSGTGDYKITLSFGGGGQAVHGIVPLRYALSSQHSVNNPDEKAFISGENEFYLTGVDRNKEWLFTAYRNQDGGYDRVMLNPRFPIERMKTLKLDEQVLEVFKRLPDSDPRKSILMGRIDPSLTSKRVVDGEEVTRYAVQDYHDRFYAPSHRQHYKNAVARIEEITASGFGGNRILQNFFWAATQFDYHGLGKARLRVEKLETELTAAKEELKSGM